VDATAEVVDAAPEGEGRRLRIAVPSEVRRYLVERGSVTVDGVSLTVAALNGEAFEAALIPETLARTTLAEADAGTRVNLECDVLGKYAIDHHSKEKSE
jgi:riboflavin synthase